MREFDLNIEKVLENWNVAHAIREIIANALDEKTITNTQDIKIYKENNIWHIRDFGRGLKYLHLTQNENDEKLSHPQLIGKFGVGLKDALATFDRHKINVVIYSRYGRITLGKSKKHGFEDIVTLHAYIDQDVASDFVGTDFCIEGCSDFDIEQAKEYFLYFSDMKLMENTEYGSVYKKRNDRSEIFINGIKVAEEENFLFSYNITSLNAALRKALNRERTNVGRSAYSDRVRNILLNAHSEKVIEAFTEDLTKMSKGQQCDEMKWIDVQTHAVKILNAKRNTVFVTPDEIRDSGGSVLEVVRESGKIPVFVPETVKRKIEGETDINGQQISTISTVIQEYNQSFEYEFISYDGLSYAEQEIFDLIPQALEILESSFDQNRIFISEKLKTDFSVNAVGLYDKDENRIIILRSQLSSKKDFLGTLIHELIHAQTGMPDVSRGFESELTSTIGILADQIIKHDEDRAKLELREICKGNLKKVSVEILEKFGKVAFDNDYTKEAIIIYSELLRRNQKAEYYYYRANQFKLSNDLDKALTDINQALSLRPREVEYLIEKVLIFIDKEDREAAYGLLNYALELDPNNNDILVIIAQSYLDKQDLKNALVWLYKIYDKNPNDISAIATIVSIEWSVNKKLDYAIKFLEKALEENSKSARLYFAKASLLMEKRHFKEAMIAIEKALEIDDSEKKYHQVYGALKTILDGHLSYTL